MGKFKVFQVTLLSAMLAAALAGTGFAQEEASIKWMEGPAVVDIGEGLAQLEMGGQFLFAGPEDTRAVMEYLGNPPTNEEVGMIIPSSEEGDWFIVFEYSDVGYISDEDKDSIDAAAILESYRKGTEEANDMRVEMGAAPIHVTGWYEEPHYDVRTKNLTWAMLLENDEKMQTVNYNVRILGRGGYMSAVLVSDPVQLAALKPQVDSVIANLTYMPGNRYSEYVQGDRLADIGLTALIAGGAGAAAVKFGLFKALAKFGKAILVVLMAFFAFIARSFKGIFKSEEKLPMGSHTPQMKQ